ncbi:HlyD family efflux transporter periplasmic adaptor subunit [Deferribacter autotrophicus]|uniref:HlyD family efflux transporter periplasmic adaptor subunit n=1 Tax=Deferribacter autotrophicus TaxID=500465 RepID=A0A5A8F7H2_9BACT|nr:efflux RND transporter periplasmic adaptor subunit [Deferribacter autotrophicus]KAA0258087.1 HlyD family efflux transporter periplasmic adaptor subunit [Deferribacter autotrophicus]
MKKIAVLVVVVLLVVLILLSVTKKKNLDSLTISGRIEVDVVDVSPKVSGEVVRVYFDEGDEVKRGDILVELGREELDEKTNQLIAKKRQVENGIRAKESEIQSYRVKLKQLLIKKEKVSKDVELAIEIAKNEIKVASANVKILEEKKDVIFANLRKVEKDYKRYKTLYNEGAISKSMYEDISLKFDTLKSEFESVKKELESARHYLSNSKKNLERAKLQRKEIDLLDKEIKGIQEVINIKMSEKQGMVESLNEVKAMINELQIKINDTYVRAPIDGVIMSKNINFGEIAVAYQPVYSLYDPKKIYFKGFFPEKYLSRIKLGDKVKVYVDGLEKGFDAKISYVSDRAEFTPKEVQTKEERVKQVFAIKAYFNKPDKYLKPGMPADMIFHFQ